MKLPKTARIALRWACVIIGLGLGSCVLLAVYGVALVDRAMSAGTVPDCTKVVSAPLIVRSGELWPLDALGDALARRGWRAAPAGTLPTVCEYSTVGTRLVLGAGFRARASMRVVASGAATGLQLTDTEGRTLHEFEVGGVPIGTSSKRDTVRWPVAIEGMAPELLTAVVDIEDRTFLSHPGLSLRGMLRAAWRDLRAGGVRQGGSTITQQLARTLLLRPNRTVSRKLLEAWLAALLDHRYDKRTILGAYLNRVYLGQDGGLEVQGVGAGSHYYFGKDVANLSLEESALLAGLIAAPNRIDPFTHQREAQDRRRAVLDAMVREGHVSPGDAEAAGRSPLPEKQHRLRWPPAIHFMEMALAQAKPTGGELATSLDVDLQFAVAEGCRVGLRDLERRREPMREPHRADDPLQVAVAVVARDGRVLALQGSREGQAGEFDRAVSARRPIGSLVKPFVVAASVDAGITLDDVLLDEAITVPSGTGLWTPTNSDGRFRGKVTVREALVHSLNVPIVRLGLQTSLERVEGLLRRASFTVPGGRPAVLLGALEASPLEVARAYTCFIGDGRIPEISFETRPRAVVRSVMTPHAATMVVSALAEVAERGTAASLSGRVEGWLAAKTGTSDDRRDSWFAAIRPGFVTVVWVGFDSNRETGLFGATGALEVWRRIDARMPPAWRRRVS